MGKCRALEQVLGRFKVNKVVEFQSFKVECSFQCYKVLEHFKLVESSCQSCKIVSGFEICRVFRLRFKLLKVSYQFQPSKTKFCSKLEFLCFKIS